MGSVFCNQCGHRNAGDAAFCSSCGAILPQAADLTITLAKVDPLQDAPGPADDTLVSLADLPSGVPSLVVRSGSQAGAVFPLRAPLTRLGRHPDSEIMLDDITVSRRHADISLDGDTWVVRDAGSLNGTYVNLERVDSAALKQGDELLIGKFRLVYFARGVAG